MQGEDSSQREVSLRGGALEELRVVELGEGISAPFCAKLFGDYGADVVKIERPGAGDVTRGWGPFRDDEPHPEKSGLFFALNTNKRSAALDVSSDDGRKSILALLGSADLFIENQSPHRMREWGLDYASLEKSFPELVVVSITPFGQTGPYADWKGTDLNAYHMTAAGMRYCGKPDCEPLEQGTFTADFFGGYVAVAWGLAAVAGRSACGGGQHVDVSCAEAMAALFAGAQNVGGYAQDGIFDTRTGIGMSLGAPATILPCKDGHVWMMALEPGQWNGLVEAMGNPGWAQVELFQDMFERARNADTIYPLIEAWAAGLTKVEIMDLCQAHGCPTTAVFTVAEIAEHPHLAARNHIVSLEHPEMGTVRVLGAPVRLPDCPGGPRRAAPRIGEHTAEVLAEVRGEKRVRARPTARAARPVASDPRALPLAGLRVANFGWGWLGPVVGQTLAFLGAEVYKIESRARIDINRTLPPFAGGVQSPDRSLQNHAGWAGNGSITLNLKTPEGQKLARRLVSHCDVAIENFGPGVLEKLGLGYDVLRAERPDLVMASLPAAGLTGPLSGVRTYGTSLCSLAALDSLTGYIDGPPVPTENAFADPLGGIIGAFGILVALRHRERTGRGQHIDCSQQEGILQLIAPAFMDYTLNGRNSGTLGNRHPLAAAAPHGVFPCAGDDRWIAIAITNDAEWRALAAAIGDSGRGWARAPEFDDLAGRLARLDELHSRLSEWTRDFDDYALAHELQRDGVAATPVLNIADLLNDPHFRARGTFVEMEHPLGFRETIYGAYVKTSRTRQAIRPGPSIGQDNEYVFKELLGVSEDRFQTLVDEQVIY